MNRLSMKNFPGLTLVCVAKSSMTKRKEFTTLTPSSGHQPGRRCSTPRQANPPFQPALLDRVERDPDRQPTKRRDDK